MRRLRLPRVGLLGLLLLALGLRVWAMVAYRPAVLTNQAHDGANYILAARTRLANGDQEPLGYPLFLRGLHAISDQLTFTIGIQHALGLLTGGLLYLTARRLGASRWLALFPAGTAWLGGDQLFLEHAPLSEALFIALLAATLYIWARSNTQGSGWLVALGVVSVLLLSVRSVALPLPVLLLAGVLVGRWRTPAAALRAAAIVAAAIAMAGFVYAAIEHAATGHWTVTAAGSGWDLYARAAEFADCRDFRPPSGTSALCDPTPPAKRLGVGYYHWLGGPAVTVFGLPPSHDSEVGAFARAAIVHQPLDFLSFVGSDFVRYLYPAFDTPRYSDYGGPETLSFPTGVQRLDPPTVKQVTAYYGGLTAPAKGAADALHSYQTVVRISGPMVFLMLIVACLGIAGARVHRWNVTLPVLVAFELLIVPTSTGATWRYAVPAIYPLAVATVVAWPLLWPRIGAVVGLAVTTEPATHPFPVEAGHLTDR